MGFHSVQKRQVLLPTLVLSAALVAFFTYLALRPPKARARNVECGRPLVVATISFATGDVEVRTREGNWKRARRGHRIVAGESLLSNKGNRVEIQLSGDTSRLRLEGDTAISLLDHDNQIECKIDKGSVWAEEKSKDPGKAEFVLSSAELVASSPSGAFRVHRLNEETSQVSVYKGSATVISGHQGKTREHLRRGHALTLTSGRSPILTEIANEGDWKDGWQAQSLEVVEELPCKPTVSLHPATMKLSLRDINPEVYLSVEVEFKGKRSTSQGFLTDEVQIQKIRVRADTWDKLPALEKVDLLNETFTTLKGKYPSIRHSVILEFDDDRPNLELKYGDTLKG
jgi:hypothetical protein